MPDATSILRNLPRVDDILAHPLLASEAGDIPRLLQREAAREAVQEAREKALAGSDAADLSADIIARRAAEILHHKAKRSLRRAINASGIILHTGLGRAPLSKAARESLAEVAAGYSNVQVDITNGGRMQREAHIERLLEKITGSKAAVVVNNNAAATLLVLNTLATEQEVIISRGEMVEIGGSFRIPDIIALSGCRLVEIGCTNRTHLDDYRNALSEDTALLLAVHQSNYRITGFTSQPPIGEIAALAHEHGLLCAHDLGSGALLDLRRFGLPYEPSVPDSLKAGADVVFFSGDKLVGGPQCGIILGKPVLLKAMRRNPFYRTFRVDKLTLSALEATLSLFLEEKELLQKHTVMAMLTCPLAEIQGRAEALAKNLQESCENGLQVSVIESTSEIGGGSLAGHSLPTAVVQVRSDSVPAGQLAARLRLGEPPIFARLHEDSIQIDLRTVLPDEDGRLLSGLQRILKQPSPDTE